MNEWRGGKENEKKNKKIINCKEATIDGEEQNPFAQQRGKRGLREIDLASTNDGVGKGETER